MSEEQLGRNEHYGMVQSDGWISPELWNKESWAKQHAEKQLTDMTVARVTLIESDKLAKVREALEHIWEILHHEGFDDTADYCTRTLALLEPLQ